MQEQLQIAASALSERTPLAAVVAETEQPSVPPDLPRSSLQAEGGIFQDIQAFAEVVSHQLPCMRKEKVTKVCQGCIKVQ